MLTLFTLEKVAQLESYLWPVERQRSHSLFDRFLSSPTSSILSFHYWLHSLLWLQTLLAHSTELKLSSSVSRASWWELQKWTFSHFQLFSLPLPLSTLFCYPSNLLRSLYLLPDSLSLFQLSLALDLSWFWATSSLLDSIFPTPSISLLSLSPHPRDRSTQTHHTHTLSPPTYALLNDFRNFLLPNSFYYHSTPLVPLIPNLAMPKR